jgi:putative ABC transport system permease protein
MEIRPILSTLGRHRTAAALIILEIALSCAIVSNAVFLVGERLKRMKAETGLAESELVHLQLAGIGRDADPVAVTRQDLAALRALPGVKQVAHVNQLPFGGSAWQGGIKLDPDQKHPTVRAAIYLGSEDLIETLGLRLVGGRDFKRDEYVEFELDAPARTVILTRTMVERLFPGKSGLGESFYGWGNEPLRVVGVVDYLRRPNDVGDPGESLILPVRAPFTVGGSYVIRVDPARRAETLAAAAAALDRVSPNRILLNQQTLDEMRRNYFRADRAMAWLLAGVCVALLVITALGIVGLASFWVQQRTRQIGIRRALGATRGQILRYFQTENFLLATLGVVLGMALAYGMSLWLMARYELPRLPAAYLPVGAACLWTLGQLAVLGPALRASHVPPAVATRTV